VDTKKRLQARIGASDKDFARFRFALIQAVTFKQPSYIEDGEPAHAIRLGNCLNGSDDNIYEHKFAPEDVLGLDHVDKSGKTRAGTGEKAIVIRG
jgi:ubiquitin carboxyl-terminal hydrolase 7